MLKHSSLPALADSLDLGFLADDIIDVLEDCRGSNRQVPANKTQVLKQAAGYVARAARGAREDSAARAAGRGYTIGDTLQNAAQMMTAYEEAHSALQSLGNASQVAETLQHLEDALGSLAQRQVPDDEETLALLIGFFEALARQTFAESNRLLRGQRALRMEQWRHATQQV